MSCHQCDYALIQKNNIWFPENSKAATDDCFTSFEGTTLRERAQADLSSSRFESASYVKIIQKALAVCNKGGVILELGAGDGRFTELLLEKHMVIANEINAPALLRLRDSVSKPENLFCLCCSFDELPVRKQSILMITAIECLCYANENYENTIRQLVSLLELSGFFLDSEPLIDGAISYNLANNDFHSASLAIREHRKEEKIGDSVIKSRIFQQSELNKIYADNNLTNIFEDRTPQIASLLVRFYSSNKEHYSKNKIVELFERYQDGPVDNGRCQITMSQLQS